jgi:DNA (cytosine-5)-methyltransferase 1
VLEDAWQAHLDPRAESAPTFISTFSGGGGSSLGFSMAGYRELLAVEWDNNAIETFRLNFPDVPIFHGDIAKLSVEEVLERTGLRSGELDVLDGSPPCFPGGHTVLTTCGKIPNDDTKIHRTTLHD